MAVVYTNNASTSLSSGIDSSTTSITVGSVADFPTLTGSDYYYATIANTTNTKIEIVKVTAASGTTLTVVRGQDDTTATNFDSGDNFQIRVTSATLDSATKSDVDIGGGEIDGTPIGANSASTGSFTNITVSGTVDGRDVATDGTKLDTIETNADVTDTTNVVAALTAGTNITIAADGTISSTDTDTGILNVVEDTTPQLGGNLDTNGKNIEFGDSSGSTDDRLKFGASGDLSIYHDGSNSIIDDTGTGNLQLRGTNVQILSGGGTESYITCAANGAVDIRYDNSSKFATTSTGVSVTGNVAVSGTVDGRDVATDGTKLDGIESGATADQTASEILTAIKTVDGPGSGLDADTLDGLQSNSFLRSDAADSVGGNLSFADAVKALFGAGNDLEIYHSGSASYIAENGSGNLKIRGTNIEIQNSGATANYITCIDGGATNLFYNGTNTLATTSSGVSVTGGIGVTANVTGTNFYATEKIGYDSNDYISFSNNSHMNVYVNGSNEFRFEADGDFHADGDVIAYSTTVSDERLKENIQPIDDALSKVKQLKGCTFTYTADGKESAGLIAQDVEKVLPSAVTEKELPLKTDDGKEYKVLQYDQTIGLLVEAIKELSAKVEELENK